jgi:hypothetical protein
MYRSIILAKGGRFWVYEYLFAKQDRNNIADDELAAFRSLAAAYERLSDQDIAKLIANRKFCQRPVLLAMQPSISIDRTNHSKLA